MTLIHPSFWSGEMRDMIKTHDAEIIIGWPTTEQDEQQLTVGIVYYPTVGDPVSAWATLDSPEQVAIARRALQRGGRVVWPREVEEITGNTFVDAPVPSDDVVKQMSATYDHLSPFGPVATGLVTPAPTDEPA